jgi:hypothetical protein
MENEEKNSILDSVKLTNDSYTKEEGSTNE